MGGTTGSACSPSAAPGAAPSCTPLVTAAATWAVLGGTSLDREGRAVAGAARGRPAPEARQRLTHLVGRDTRTLTSDEVARAVVESVAENTSDAVVAPLVLGAVAGVPGLLGYRAANTLDAMVGHRSERYAAFGWASARLDDLLNLPGLPPHRPARRPPRPRPPRRPDAPGATTPRATPAPTPARSRPRFAGALGLRLGGTNHYGARTEHRPVMGSGRAPTVADVSPALALASRRPRRRRRGRARGGAGDGPRRGAEPLLSSRPSLCSAAWLWCPGPGVEASPARRMLR